MKILKEFEETILHGEEDALQTLQQIADTDIVKKCYTSEIKVHAINDEPLFMADIREELGVPEYVSDESMQEVMQEINLGASIPLENSYPTLPLRETAFTGLLKRAGYEKARVLTTLQDKNALDRMSNQSRATILNLSLECFKDKTHVLIRDEKISAFCSGDDKDYTYLPFINLVSILKEELKNVFDNVKFMVCSLSHELFTIRYEFDSEEIAQKMSDVLNSTGIKVRRTGVKLGSSDVGLSGANLYPYIVTSEGQEVMVGSVLKLVHQNTSLDDFEKNAKLIMSVFKDAEERLREMENISINHIRFAIINAGKKAGVPMKFVAAKALEYEDLFDKNAKKIDIFSALYAALYEYEQIKPLPEVKRLNLQEGIARVIFSDIDYLDVPYAL